MKLGLGLYRHMLNEDSFAFAQQCGCTDIIIHLAEYYTKEIVTATDECHNYGRTHANDPIWSEAALRGIVQLAADHGLRIAGIENFSPADWYDVLLDGPRKEEQMENLERIITITGKVGIPVFGYNFSLAGVWGHSKAPKARGGALSTCFDADQLALDAPIPLGEIWNMTYDPDAPAGHLRPIGYEELWERLAWFLRRILPVAERAGVKMALHPDDPPMPYLRATPRLVYQPELYQKALDLVPSPANMLEFCMGSLQEMTHGTIEDTIRQYAGQGKIAYVHFRNVKGKVPHYTEVFVDDGDIDMLRALALLDECGFDGVIMPDHTPQIRCDAPWHAGMAYALGYMRAALTGLEKLRAQAPKGQVSP